MRYVVDKIYEADYGCEERMPEDPALDIVYLKDQQDESLVIHVPDRELYQKDIAERDVVDYNPITKRLEKWK